MAHKIRGIYAIIDPQAAGGKLSPFEIASDLLSGGVRVIQLRQKKGTPGDIEINAHEILDLKSEHDFTFMINDDPWLASRIGADGVHLGVGDMPVGEARRILGSAKIIGKSTHSIAEAKVAEKEGADYISCGAIFPSPTKNDPSHPVVGVSLLKEVLEMVRIPVVAIGGINRINIMDVLRTNVPSVALISGLMGAEDIKAEARFFSSLFHLH
ncbi:MAG: thiamine phosphate synthase [Deltaproteobacteria bacterium]|nr:thiamine phosphate synthase [Deltaproteobacteria bacterium]